MHKKFTLQVRAVTMVFAFIFLVGAKVLAQDLTPWTNGNYGQEWIDYSKKYVRIGVPANGIYSLKVNLLPSDFPVNDPSKFQLWHRGQEVAIISADATEIVFYGEKNDGVSDGLTYRPGPEARMNTFVSMYSDEGSYFLTIAPSPLRLSSVSGVSSGTISAEPNHLQTDSYFFSNQFSYITNGVGSVFNNSFFESFEAYTGNTTYGANAIAFGGVSTPKNQDNALALKNWDTNSSTKPSLEVLVNGLYQGAHSIQVLVGLTSADADLKNLATISFSGLGSEKRTVALNLNEHLASNGAGFFRVNSNTSSPDDWFGLSYYSITYPQLTDLGGAASVLFNFLPTSSASRRISIKNASSNTEVYDLSNPLNPVKIINGILSDNTLTVDINGVANKAFKLFVIDASQKKQIASANIYPVSFSPVFGATDATPTTVNGAVNPSAYDYLIVTNDKLQDVAKTYASDYRSTTNGGSYKTLVVNIRKIYDEFNYGEPSPLAIRRFVNYMLKDGIRTKHNLLLIGHSVSWPSPGRLLKEMNGEVPTFGDPGSDVLLVAGLKGANIDVPAIPVGRISAFQPAEVTTYMGKVDLYEHETSVAWRKKVLHLVGGDEVSQVEEFENIFTDVSSYVTSLDASRSIKTYSNNPPPGVSPPPVQLAPITTDVGDGVGMISYYGHGNQVATLLDMQYISKAVNPSYPATKKYPFVYFNGCGVGNIYSSRLTPTLATDWLLTPDKGAIAIIANSYKSFVTPTKIYLDYLYKEIFLKTDTNRRTIGQILKDVANITITGSANGRVTAANAYDIANIHQTTLFGDPALRVLNTSGALPVELISFTAGLYTNNEIKLDWKTASEKNNSHYVVERSYNAKVFEEIGYLEGKGDFSSETSYTFIDKAPNAGTNYYRLKQVDKGDAETGISGQATYSKIVSVKLPDTDEVILYPNPASTFVSIALNVPTGLDSWTLFDMSGKVLQKGTSKSVSLDKLSTGSYIIKIYTVNGDSYHRTVLKK
ncbi:putative type IX secretion system sortase PorU2 [Dyadobacter frigoris]|uniref:T9SS type A sorting domain-containing protein n=1 Tax=Dyadobacter frigoris TaxID=2576211 RepID=A0A4U6D9G3_9BACT|nr:C25 family cysteine peptidase [Dyadobacter frigoris]TKT93436.1 T9SS type A sorting domain-containing protein [Dyadobacter frigoris]GLU55841.1 hypothetical protein Dfri01_53020 [Dyadobacter frigoris]